MAVGWKHFTGKSQYPELTSNSTHSAFTYGSKQDRRYRMKWIQGKRDLREERNILNWVGKVVGVEFPEEYDEILEMLQDGTILCSFLNGLNQHALNRSISTKASLFAATENITNFQESILNFGLREVDLFPTNEIVEKRDLTGLIRTLVLLKKKAIINGRRVDSNDNLEFNNEDLRTVEPTRKAREFLVDALLNDPKEDGGVEEIEILEITSYVARNREIDDDISKKLCEGLKKECAQYRMCQDECGLGSTYIHGNFHKKYDEGRLTNPCIYVFAECHGIDPEQHTKERRLKSPFEI